MLPTRADAPRLAAQGTPLWRKGWALADGSATGASPRDTRAKRCGSGICTLAAGTDFASAVLCNPCGILFKRGWYCSWCGAARARVSRPHAR